MAPEDPIRPGSGSAASDHGLFARKGRATARGFGPAAAVDVVAADVARTARSSTVIGIGQARLRVAPLRARRCALVADGDPLSRKLYRDLLEADGYEVVIAADGRRALEAVRRHAPDIAIVNLRLADLSGLELARRIAADGPRPAIPVIAITESYSAADDSAARAGSCAAYLAKPISVRVLLDTVDGLMPRRDNRDTD